MDGSTARSRPSLLPRVAKSCFVFVLFLYLIQSGQYLARSSRAGPRIGDEKKVILVVNRYCGGRLYVNLSNTYSEDERDQATNDAGDANW